MSPSAYLVLILVVAAAIPVAAAADPPPRPLAAYYVASGPDVIITWVAGAAPVDWFHVYGESNGSRELIANVSGSERQVILPLAYPSFSVTASRNNEESPPAQADAPPCISLYPGVPPGFAIGCTGGVRDKVNNILRYDIQVQPERILGTLATR